MIQLLSKVALTAAICLASHAAGAQVQPPTQAQPQATVKELLGRAQTEADKRAVEDFVRKLKLRPGAAPAGQPDSGAAKTPLNPSQSTTPALAPKVVAEPAPTPPPVRLPAAGPPPPTAGRLPNISVVIPLPPSSAPVPPAPPAPIGQAPEITLKMLLPTVDFEVFFNLDSAEITPQAVQQLRNLGHALADQRLAGSKFVIAGHTDAFGPPAYNLALSQRRAEAVRTFVIENFQVPPDNLIARGFGSQSLKKRNLPFSPENRRVQVVNWTGQTVSGPSR